jgi:hypothetical protein
MTSKRIAMWSGPRNISTAMMRAWENRPDTCVWDEPLYGPYLHSTGIAHPGSEAIIADQGRDWRPLVERCVSDAPDGAAVFYQKQMTHHLLPSMDWDWLAALDNCFLIRSPEEVLASYRRTRPDATEDDLGIIRQAEIFDHVTRLQSPPLVIDAKDFLLDPRGMLELVCTVFGLEFDECMLSWPPGKRSSDGVWGPHWYDSVWASTGFERYRPRNVVTPPAYNSLLDTCMPHYERLHALRVRA